MPKKNLIYKKLTAGFWQRDGKRRIEPGKQRGNASMLSKVMFLKYLVGFAPILHK